MDETDGAADPLRRKLYGRRHGKRLKPNQQRLLADLLPRLRVAGVGADENPGRLPLAPLYSPTGGRSGSRSASAPASIWWRRPRRTRRSGWSAASPSSTASRWRWRGSMRAGVGNVRLHAGDARDLIELLPAASVGRVFLLYPDPWPKARHARRRFASRENLALLAPAVAPGAELRAATDIHAYAEHALAEAAASPDWRLVSDSADALGGLAGDALRGQGAEGGAAAALPDVGPRVIARAQFRTSY